MNDKTSLVLIGFDAWGAYSFPKADMPMAKRMAQNGSSTMNARCVRPAKSSCNWASMVMGADPDIHGYIDWDTTVPAFETPTDHYGIFPTIFALMRDQRPELKIGYFYEWDLLRLFCPDAAAHRKEMMGSLSYDPAQAERIADYIREEKPDFTFIQFDEPDHRGHEAGHDTPPYYELLTRLDSLAAIIEKGVKDSGAYDDTIFILTSDHGGVERDHGGDTPMERNIPLIVFGKNVRKGYTIKSMVMIYDIPATMAYIFGVKTPQPWIGRPITEIFIGPFGGRS
jgi:predicted AlkP superfamily pyrophosphatase or phosphodiesterase